MKSFFKYSVYRKDFFNNPKLRITQRISLNDPFECLPTTEQVARLYDRIFKAYQDNGFDVKGNDLIGNQIRTSDSNFQYQYTHLFNKYGIVSLSSTYDNLLMWSHYTNQHKGIVIELDIKKLGLANKICHSLISTKNTTQPQKVRYNNNREIVDLNSNSFNYLFDAFFVKSKQWKYEKEYRIVGQLTDSTEVKIRKESWDVLLENKYDVFFNKVECDKDYFALSLNSKAYLPNDEYTFGDDPDKMLTNLLYNAYSRLAEHPTTLFLYDIPKDAIKKVIIGCEMPKVEKEDIYRALTQYETDIEVFEASRHPGKFELILKKNWP